MLLIEPPMCITTADVDFMLEVLDIAFGKACYTRPANPVKAGIFAQLPLVRKEMPT